MVASAARESVDESGSRRVPERRRPRLSLGVTFAAESAAGASYVGGEVVSSSSPVAACAGESE